MVRQSYLYRLALGRSAFEPPEAAQTEDNVVEATTINDGVSDSEYVQSYNSRGHPQNLASRSLARRNIRAQNEVLATVHVCARVDAEKMPVLSHKETSQSSEEQLESIIEENEVGFWFSVDDELMRLLTTTFVTNLRRRIQTFDFYGGISLITILRVECTRQGLLQTFLAGQVATTVYALLFGASIALIGEGREMLVQRFVSTRYRRSRRRLHSTAIDTGVRILKWGVFCALLPLQTYATLQRLNLLPLWPLLPYPFTKTLFIIAFPKVPTTRNRQALVSWSIALLTSPVMVTIVMQILGSTVQTWTVRYLRAAIPRPDNPDQLTHRMLQDESFDDSTGIVKYSRFQSSLREEVQRDIEAFKQGFTNLRLQIRNVFRKMFFVKRPSVEFGGVEKDDNEGTSPLSEAPPEHSALPQSANLFDSMPVTVLPPVITEAPWNGTADSPLFTPTSSDGHEEPEDSSPSNVRIRTRTGSTSTLHLDVEISSSTEVGATVHTSSFAASPYPPAVMDSSVNESNNAPHHRVTALSLYAAESLNSRIAGLLSSLFRLPLEAFYIRMIARNFLQSQNSQHWLLPHIYPLNCWFGLGIPDSNIDYASKILLCFGTEAIITTQVWYLACKGAFWMGRRWYGWESL